MKRGVERATRHLSRRQLLVILGLLVLIGAAAGAILIQRNPEPQPPIAAPPQATPLPGPAVQTAEQVLHALPPREQLARAFEAAFGRRDAVQIEVQNPDSLGGYVDRVEFKPGRLIWTGFGPVLISEGQVVDASHASAGKLAVHYLAPSVDGFTVTKTAIPAVVTGSQGVVGSWGVRDDLTDFPTVAVNGGGTFQGFTCTILTLLELRPEGPVEIADVPVYDSNSGYAEGGEAVTMKGKLANIVKNRSFDVHYSGSRSLIAHYEREGMRYARRGDQVPLAACPQEEGS